MQSATPSATMRSFGLKNTLRFTISAGNVLPDRDTFERRYLFEVLKIKPEDIYCLQKNASSGFYDVTLMTITCTEEAYEAANRLADTSMKPFQVASLCRTNSRIVTVHMYNPWVGEESIRYFLNRYMRVLPGIKEIKDVYGIWTGKRQFRVELREDPSGYGGFLHPPAAFSIGADRGYLLYAGQPRCCRRCNMYGHEAETCTQIRCRNCNALGHIAKDCTEVKTCNLCGAADHLAKNCHKPETYASILKQSTGAAAQEGRGTDKDGIGVSTEVELQNSQIDQHKQLGLHPPEDDEGVRSIDVIETGKEDKGAVGRDVQQKGKSEDWTMAGKGMQRPKKIRRTDNTRSSQQSGALHQIPLDNRFAGLAEEAMGEENIQAEGGCSSLPLRRTSVELSGQAEHGLGEELSRRNIWLPPAAVMDMEELLRMDEEDMNPLQ